MGGYTLLYYTRAHEGMGVMGMRGLMGGWEKDSAMGIAGRDFYRTGDFTGRGKHVYKGGERGLHGREKGGQGEGGKKKNPSLVGEVRDFINLQL